ncbi:MAG: TlpA family protein disulfide reductase [Marinilabiliaceae bacterium]|nr:TlpA family protein disulfide reductase [Marinilabiliaceae bacterium]
MNKIILLTTFLIFTLHLSAQNSFSGKIEYADKTYFKTQADSVNYSNFTNKYPASLIEEMGLTEQDKEVYLVTKDTVLISDQWIQNGVPEKLYLATPKNYLYINTVSGNSMRWKEYRLSKFSNFNNYERIDREDITILGRSCKAYIQDSKKGWQKIWLSDIPAISPNKKNTRIIIDNKVVLKSIYFSKSNNKYTERIATSIDCDYTVDIAKVISAHNQVNTGEMYAPIVENNKIANAPIKLGQQLPDLYCRAIFNPNLIRLHDIAGKSEYTAIEFWGTWCMPCLIASSKIKQLKSQYKDGHFNVLSLNTRDRDSEKIKQVITTKGMEWDHGYSTTKLINVLNTPKKYPTMVIVNRQKEILFIGNPNTEMDAIIQILDGKG